MSNQGKAYVLTDAARSTQEEKLAQLFEEALRGESND
jgi:hypothetical protein